MKKKLFSVLLVSALAASLLAGCGKSKKAEVDNTEVETVTEQSTEVEKVETVSSDKVSITGELGKGVSLDYTEVATDTEEYKAVEEYLKDTNSTFEMFDINLLDKDKNKVQPNGEVEVSVKLSDTMKNAAGDAYVVFHNQGADFTRINATEKDGYVTFKTTHFSIYTVVKYDSTEETTEQKIEEVKNDDNTTNVASNDTKTVDNSSINNNNNSNSNTNVEVPKQEAQEAPVKKEEQNNNSGASEIQQDKSADVDTDSSQNTAPTEPATQPEAPAETPTYKNPCPYQLNVITTYDGHEGFFSNGEGGIDVETELTKDYWAKGGVTNKVETFIGEYDDCISPNNPTGSVRFQYFYWTEN